MFFVCTFFVWRSTPNSSFLFKTLTCSIENRIWFSFPLGLLLEISRSIYGLEMGVTILHYQYAPLATASATNTSVAAVQARIRLDFDNRGYVNQAVERQRRLQRIDMPPVSCSVLFRWTHRTRNSILEQKMWRAQPSGWAWTLNLC